MLTKKDLSEIGSVIDSKLKPIESRLKPIEFRLTTIESKLKPIESRLKTIGKDLKSIKASVTRTDNYLAGNLDTQIVNHGRRIKRLEDHANLPPLVA